MNCLETKTSKQFQEFVTGTVDTVVNYFDCRPPKIRFRNTRCCYGHIRESGLTSITIADWLAKYPPEFQVGIASHEVCHTLFPRCNGKLEEHGPRFMAAQREALALWNLYPTDFGRGVYWQKLGDITTGKIIFEVRYYKDK